MQGSMYCMCRAFSFAGGGLAAAEKLHETLLRAIIKAPISFFDKVPTGTRCTPASMPLSSNQGLHLLVAS